jgi:hypothetical protein
MRMHRNPPVVHWCEASQEYLNIPVDEDGNGRYLGECPYCGAMLWLDSDATAGAKGGRGPAEERF